MPVRSYSAERAGWPDLNGNSASLIALLDAVLVNGSSTLSVSSITRSGTTATVTTATAHDYQTGDWILVADANEAAYNGAVKITRGSSTTFTYEVTGSPSTPATGTITCRYAPAGFEKKYSGTGKAVYRSLRSDSNKHYLRVVDDASGGATYKSAVCYSWESMDDVDTGTAGCPTPNAQHWAKSNTTDGTARWWRIITDGRLVYFFAGTNIAKTAGDTLVDGAMAVWGDFKSVMAGDIYNVIHAAYTAAYTNINVTNSFLMSCISGSSYSANKSINIARSYNQALSVVNNAGIQGVSAGNENCLGNSVAIPFPNKADSGFYIAPCILYETTNQTLRGVMPGCYQSYHGNCFSNNTLISGVSGMPNKKLVMLYVKSSGYIGGVVIDIAGDDDGEWW